jgi:hypothetical protein
VRLLYRLRRSSWFAGLVLLLLAAAIAAPAVHALGWRRWPLHVGILAAALLVFGWIERRWNSRPLPRPYRVADRSRFRVVPGGKDKGNGHARDLPGDAPKDDGDKPRWVM